MYLNQEYDYITDYIAKTNPSIKQLFDTWLNIKNSFLSQVNITPREVNERIKTFNKPFNAYCKINYIDNNFIVDQILQMSLPYSDGRNTDDKRNLNAEFNLTNNINPEKLVIFNGSFENNLTSKKIEKDSAQAKPDTWNDIYQIYTKPRMDSCNIQ
jgi:hypothetical protein